MTNATILALDASSTTIGFVIYADDAARDCGEISLKGNDIADRCRQAHACLNLILHTHPDVDAVALESPVSRFAKAVIPQARVSGALMAAAMLNGINVVEVTPSQAKKALTGSGCAGKLQMQAEALRYGVVGEHAADALGVALSAVGRVRVVEVAAA
jgi:Holliday junction resolvasome RuvABC endonuclease subunit